MHNTFQIRRASALTRIRWDTPPFNEPTALVAAFSVRAQYLHLPAFDPFLTESYQVTR
jgi:hypothetical protein